MVEELWNLLIIRVLIIWGRCRYVYFADLPKFIVTKTVNTEAAAALAGVNLFREVRNLCYLLNESDRVQFGGW